MERGCGFGDDSSRDGLESITRGVAVIRGCRGRAGIGSTRGAATGFELCVTFAGVRWVWRGFVRGVDEGASLAEFVRGVDGPPCASQARNSAERSLCPCVDTSSSSRVSSSSVRRKPTCRIDAISARAGLPMRFV